MRAKRTFVAAAFTAAALLSSPALARDAIFISADDIPHKPQVGGYSLPGLRTVAAQGVKYEIGYGAPLCTPARAETLTGRIGDRFGMSGNRPRLPTSVPNMATLFRNAGWDTYAIGKFHVGPLSRTQMDYGFNHLQGTPSGFVKYFGASDTIKTYNDRVRFINTGNITDRYVATAVRWLNETTSRDRLFYVALNNAHDPVAVNDAQRALVPPGLTGKARDRAALQIQFDVALQRIVAAATPDDLIIATGDNGFQGTGLRGKKGSVYEGGIRIFFEVRAPGRLPAGEVRHTPVRLADVLPTMLDWAHIPAPGNLDGQSLLQPVPNARPMLFVNPRLGGADYGQALVYGRWKYLYKVGGIVNQLYELSTDPRETTNVAARRPDVVQVLRTHLLAELRK